MIRSLLALLFVATLAPLRADDAPASAPATTASDAPAFSSKQKGNIFGADSGTVTLRIPRGEQVAGGAIQLHDEQDRLLQEIAVPAKAPSVDVPLPGKGFYRLDATVRYDDGKTAAARSSAAVVGPLLDPATRMKSHLGLWTVHGDPELIVTAGGRWNRRMITLANMAQASLENAEAPPLLPSPSAPAFTDVAVFSFGFPYWIYDLPEPEKKTLQHPFQAPKSWETLKRLVKAYVARPPNNQPFPPYLEIYNEPEWQWKGSVEDFVRTEKTIAQAVKEVRPDVKVLGPGFSTIRIHDKARIDLDQVEKLGLLDSLDGIVLHAYCDGTPPEGEFIGRVRELKDYLAKIGRADFPIHLTEFGWCTEEGTWQKPVDELTQARYVVRSLVLLGSEGIENATYFCELFRTAKHGERAFSVVRDDLTPKPSYAAYAATAHWLAGVEGAGRRLRLSPSVNFVVFRKDGGLFAVAWNTAGEKPFLPPCPVGRVEDMTGRPVSVPASGLLPLSPSPLFIELKDASLDRIAFNPPLRLMRGTTAPLPAPSAGSWSAPDPLTLQKDGIAAPADGEKGDYLLLGRDGDGWRGQPVEVISPVKIVSAALRWPADKAAPEVEARLQSFAPASIQVQAVAKLAGTPDAFSGPVPLGAGEEKALRVPLGELKPGVRYAGRLAVESRNDGKLDRVDQPLDVTLVPATRLADGAEPDWAKIAPVDFSRWDPFNLPPDAVAKGTATVKVAYGEKGLRLLVRIRAKANTQHQTGENIWKEDSLQIGLDPDAEKSWEANDLFGLKGHRVFEYGVGWNGTETLNWRWASYLPELPAAASEPRLAAQTRRDGDVTEYDVTFPWETLGLKAGETPPAGSAVGFALVASTVNPDKPGEVRVLRLFHGVRESKNPEAFGRIWFR